MRQLSLVLIVFLSVALLMGRNSEGGAMEGRADGNEGEERIRASITVDGAEIFYSISPTASPEKLWSLWPTSVGLGPYQRLTAPELAEVLSIVHVELRASGNSGGEASELTFDRIAADLDEVRRHLELERVAVLGHSVLGVLAIEYARRFPETVSHVIAVGTPPIGDMARVEATARQFFEADATDERQRRLAENLSQLPEAPSMGQMLFAQAPRQFYDLEVDPAPYFEGARTRPEFFAQLMGPLTAGWTAESALPDLWAPLLLAFGRHDYSVPYTMWERITDNLAGVTFTMFPESGHYPFFEEGARFAEEVAGWLASDEVAP